MSDEALRTFERARATGDLAAHAAIKAYRERRSLPPEGPAELYGDSNWDQAFGVAGDEIETWLEDVAVYGKGKENGADIRPARESNVSLVPFDRRDIKRLIGSWHDDHDGWSGLALMELWDGRYAFLRAGCDYTGWD